MIIIPSCFSNNKVLYVIIKPPTLIILIYLLFTSIFIEFEQIIEQIKDIIKKGELRCGDKLPSERDLCEQLNVSRTSVREALRSLEMLGIVECRQGEGNYIRESFEGSLLEPLSITFMLHGIVAFNELVIQLGIDKASLSRILNNLAVKDFIKIEKSHTDKRMKYISMLPLGVKAIINGDYESNKFINQILHFGYEDGNNSIAKAFKEFHLLALKNNLIKDNRRIKIEKVSSNYMDDAIRLAIEVFTYEQNIPEKLIPIDKELNPIDCEVVGEPIDFYGESVTPVTIKKYDFINKIKL